MRTDEREGSETYEFKDPKTDPKTALLVKIDSMSRSRIVSEAFRKVDRKDFIPQECDPSLAYKDTVVDLGEKGATISQPSLSALMVDCLGLTGKEKVLEIGTGSGYLTAILSLCAAEVHTIEYNEKLSRLAQERLNNLGCKNVRAHHGDGVLGLPEHAPYDGIIVTAGANSVPDAFIEQLAPYGRLVIPVGKDPINQQLTRGIKYPSGLLAGAESEVFFHPLMSEQHGGWTEESINVARAFKKMMFLKLAEQHGLSEKDVVEEKAKEMGVSPESFDLDRYVEVLRFPEEIWEQFDEYLIL